MVDVTVRGAGVFGLAVAFAVAAKGAKVRVVDPNGPGAGASGGLAGALSPHVPENWNDKKAFQFDSLAMGEDFWGKVAATGGVSPGYARSGRLQPIADDRALDFARARTQTAQELWQGRFDWQVIEATGDWAPISPTGFLIHDTLTARIAPRRAVAALVAAVRALGGEVTDAAPDAGKVVWATGAAGLADLSAHFGKEVGGPIKGQAALVALDAADRPQIFANGVLIIPHEDGTTAIGSTSERDFAAPDTCDHQLEDVLACARALLPALADAPVIERWAGLRPRARSLAPMLGPWPGRPGHFIANGGFKIGFGMAPGVGLAMADLVLDGNDRIPPGFRVEANL